MKQLIKKKSKEVVDSIESPVDNDLAFVTRKIELDKVVSTGSTLLDLAISGKRRRGGGIPKGIVVEIYGSAGAGKTAVLAEICASAQNLGGDNNFLDPEARLDREYSRIYGVQIDSKNYSRPDTVEEVFKEVTDWKPKPTNPDAISIIATDSLAALSTELEMTKGDKMGMKRAKLFSEGFRKTCRILAKNNWIMACTNQIRQGDYGETTPGGLAVAFYASLRVRIRQTDDIIREIDLSEKNEKKEKEKKTNKIKKVIGIKSTCFIKKSSIDDPYREVPIYIVFGYGIDDIRGNLQYIKDMTNNTLYTCPDGKTYQSITAAIGYVEKQNLQDELKEQTIDLWETIEAKFNLNRPIKRR